MIQYRLKTKDIRSKNIVCFLQSYEEIDILSFLDIDEKILENIKLHTQNIQSSMQEYFIGNKKHEKLFIFFLQETNYKNEVLFLGKYLPKLPDDICLLASSREKRKLIFEVTELSRYCFQVYKSQKKEKTTEIYIDAKEKKDFHNIQERIENIQLARDLWEMPACELTPEVFASKVKKTKFKHVKVKVLSYKDIQKKGLGLLVAVGKWSENKPCMILLEHIKNKKKPVYGIVGKGVTFDTGGNQIKPGDHMYDMKGDMGGAAVTYALMKEIDRHNVDKNIVACLVLAENVVSSSAYKPSDIIRSYSGKTVEIIHTDAEGRLILADGISYLGKHYKTSHMMTIATLTGACMMALWYRYAGIMGTDEEMIEKIAQYSKNNTEQYVRLPFDEYFLEKTKSEIADYKNLDRSVFAGSSMGAAFLANFLENKELYTHIDIAWTYINEGEAYGKMPKWMTGFGVESLSEIFIQ